jgi:competence ComEA-like helix-hairpin-helix protein
MLKPALILLSVIVPALAQSDFPDGPAKEYIQKICLQCHQTSQLLSQRRTEADWKQTVARMAQKRGVSAPSEQFDAIAAYMAKNFGKNDDPTKLNVNKATADQIAAIIGLTPEEAKALVGYRDKHGEFRDWKEMLIIYGVDGRKLEAAKDKMAF